MTSLSCRASLLAASVLGVTQLSSAQQTLANAQSAVHSAPVAHAVRTSGAININGKLDEPAWANTPIIDSFTQAYPNPGAPATQRTDVRVLYDDAALYVGVRLYDTHPDSIVAQLARRDASGIYSDWVHVIIDSYHDRRTAFHFAVNPLGVKYDSQHSNDVTEDPNWDAVWDVATTTDSLGWTAEFRIPLSQLRFGSVPEGNERVWGFQVQRDIARNKERDTWAPWTSLSPGFVSTFGDLGGLVNVPTPERLELIPYVSTKLTRAPGDDANPFYKHNDFTPSAGADVRYGLPNGLTLTATINPDFGQAEVDPAVVNLTAFETQLPENRPFFIEGWDAFQFGRLNNDVNYQNETFFYSRRIGRAPQGSVRVPGVAYVDAADQTAILGAAKVSGKTRGWSVGLLDAVTNEESAQYVTATGTRGTVPIEPRTNYLIGRVRREFQQGNTAVGGIFTAVNRSMHDTVFTNLLKPEAYMGGLDFEHYWSARSWNLRGYYVQSRVEGSPAVIAATQMAPAHYYQRPDAEHIAFDSTRTSLGGHVGELLLQWRGKWLGGIDYKESSPGLEINDLGFQGRADYRVFMTDVGYQFDRPHGIVRDYLLSTATIDAWNFDGTSIYQLYTGLSRITFTNLWNASLQLTRLPAVQSDRLTRGGPLALLPGAWQKTVTVGSDPRRRIGVTTQFQFTNDDAGGFTNSISGTVDIRPSTVVHLTIGPSFSRTRNSNQYVLTTADALATSTYGHRYLFADLDQTTLAMTTRLDWTFTPQLSLQLYAQPLLASADFSKFKELRTPGTRAYNVYGSDVGTISRSTPAAGQPAIYTVDPDGAGAAPALRFGDPDFNLRSLRGDAVLRWEYRPGSTLFFVWQQQRQGQAFRGDFDFGRDASAIFQQQPTNVFLVKASFWLAR